MVEAAARIEELTRQLREFALRESRATQEAETAKKLPAGEPKDEGGEVKGGGKGSLSWQWASKELATLSMFDG